MQGSRYRGGVRHEVRHPKLLSRAEAKQVVELGRRHTAARWLPSTSIRLAKGRVVHRSIRRM
eukprot:3465247-Pleurochrysis_carterae.AAC.1